MRFCQTCLLNRDGVKKIPRAQALPPAGPRRMRPAPPAGSVPRRRPGCGAPDRMAGCAGKFSIEINGIIWRVVPARQRRGRRSSAMRTRPRTARTAGMLGSSRSDHSGAWLRSDTSRSRKMRMAGTRKERLSHGRGGHGPHCKASGLSRRTLSGRPGRLQPPDGAAYGAGGSSVHRHGLWLAGGIWTTVKKARSAIRSRTLSARRPTPCRPIRSDAPSSARCWRRWTCRPRAERCARVRPVAGAGFPSGPLHEPQRGGRACRAEAAPDPASGLLWPGVCA